MRKRGFEFSFAWLFALLAGAVILFLAIYFAFKLVETERYKLDTITAKQLSIVFEPLEVGLASGKSNVARLREETRIYNSCYDEGSFGENLIKLSTKSSIGKKWQKPGAGIKIANKYVFSNSTEQGRVVYFFSKPFYMPWKVSEVIFLTTKKYCFENAPENIRDEILGLNLGNVKVENCSDEIKVCFGSDSCNIRVEGACLGYECESLYDYGFVQKEGERVFYIDSLIYAAIFADKEIYECGVKRLMKRLIQQALIFKEEADFLAEKCGRSNTGFLQLVSLARSLENSQDLLMLSQTAKSIEEQNDASQCELW